MNATVFTLKVNNIHLSVDRSEVDDEQDIRKRRSKLEIKTTQTDIPTSNLQKHWYRFTKYVENYKRQIFWVTLYVLVSAGIFVERAICK